MSPTGVSNVVLTSSGDESDFGIILNDTTSFDSVDYTYVVVKPGASGSGDSGDSGSGDSGDSGSGDSGDTVSGTAPTCFGSNQAFAQKFGFEDYKYRHYPMRTEDMANMFVMFCGYGMPETYHKFQLLNGESPEM